MVLFESPEPDLQNQWLAVWFLLFISQFRQHSAFTKLMGGKYDGILKLNLLRFPKSNHCDMPSMPNGGLANFLRIPKSHVYSWGPNIGQTVW